MAKVVGVGGVFFKAQDPGKLRQWYEHHLGIKASPEGMMFTDGGPIVFSIFPATTTYLGPSRSQFMVNLRVDDLNALLEKLKADGVEIDPKREDAPYGRFAWIIDPEGNRVELWEPLPKK
jgi:predicted enzyme related to lactoylglutathione lyase